MQIEKNNINLGGISACVGILVLIFGIFMFNPSTDMGYFGLGLIEYWGNLFKDGSFIEILAYVVPVVIFAVAIANIILGALNLFGVLKSDVVFKVMGIVIATLAIIQLISIISLTNKEEMKLNEILNFGFWFILVITICGAVWTFVRNKVAK